MVMKRNPNLVGVLVHLNPEVYKKAKGFAYRDGMAAKSWIAQAVSRAVMNWKDASTRKRAKSEAEELFCDLCKSPAFECQRPAAHKDRLWIRR